MKPRKTADSKSHPVVIKLPNDLGTGRASDLFAYVLNGNGKVIETTPFKGRVAHLTASGETLKGSRLFIGSGFPAGYPSSKIDAFALAQAGAYQVSVSVNKDNEISIERLPSSAIIVPPIHFCEVQGNVSNNLIINGVPQSGPVCKAKVHICAVDWFFRWPIWLRPVFPRCPRCLKDSFVALRTGPVVPPLPDPAPGLTSDLASSAAARQAPPKSISRQSKSRLSASTPAPTLKPLPANIEDQILSATRTRSMKSYLNIPRSFTPTSAGGLSSGHGSIVLLNRKVVYTDCNGHFDGWLVSVGTPTDENVYIWVEASIGGTWVTVYKPPFPCNTYWNYACGTEINITLNNPPFPRAIAAAR